MAELSVKIGADIKDLQRKLKQSEKDLKGLEKTSLNSGKKIGSIGKEASKGVGAFSKTTANATPTVQEFSRVIQDAPYGIQGVSNNIQQLTAQFGNLSKKTGGSKAALKAMLGTLSGPAGILLAVSAITSLLVSYGDELLKSTSSTKELTDATKKYTSEARAETESLKQLLSIARDEANSKAVRQGAIDELNKNYSKYLGFLDSESVKTDAVTTSVKLLSLALIQKAKIEGVSSLIAEKTKEKEEDLIDVSLKRKEALESVKDELKRLKKENSASFGKVIDEDNLTTLRDVKEQIAAVSKTAGGLDAAQLRVLASGVKTYNTLNTKLKDVQDKLKEVINPLLNLQGELKKTSFEVNAKVNIDSGADSVIDLGTISKKDLEKAKEAQIKANEAIAERKRKLFAKIEADLIKDNENTVNDFVKQWNKAGNELKPFDGDFLEIQEGFNQIVALQNKVKELQGLLSHLNVKGEINLQGLDLSQLEQFESKLKSGLATASVFSEASSQAFSTLSQNLSNSLSTGNKVVDSFVGSIISSLGKMLSELASNALKQIVINQAAATSSAIAGGASAGAATGPGALGAIPAFIAVLVGVIGSAFSGLTSFAKGGFSGDDNLAFLNKNELVLRPMEQAALYNAIRGNGLGSLARNTTANLGTGSQRIEVYGALRGETIHLSNRRSSKKMRRFYNS